MSCARVLVVDDDVDIVEALRDLLMDEGYQVATANDGQAALDYLGSADPPCLILLDWMMPRCDGETFLRRRKSVPAAARVPVALLTADTRASQRTDLDVVVAMKKPIQLATLLGVLQQHCG